MIITKKDTKESIIRITENFRAPREKVFKAWTKPESLKKWFMAEEGVVVTDVKVDLTIGGKYFIETMFPGNEPSRIEGVFSQVLTADELAYSWLTPVLKGRMTKVEVTFKDVDNGSQLFLSHGEFLNENELELHLYGWEKCLGKLHQFLA